MQSVAPQDLPPRVHDAIVEAVRDRMGPDADVRIENLRVGGVDASRDGQAVLVARPEPGARLGRTIRFTLFRAAGTPGNRSVGYAVAAVAVTTEHARAARTLQRGEPLHADDIVTGRGEVGAVPLQRLPGAVEIVGARALRDIVANEVLTRSIVAARSMVQSGDMVAVRAAADGVTVQAQGVASQSGGPGDTIRVVNPASRRSFKARVLAPGKVEVIQ